MKETTITFKITELENGKVQVESSIDKEVEVAFIISQLKQAAQGIQSKLQEYFKKEIIKSGVKTRKEAKDFILKHCNRTTFADLAEL